MSTTDIPTKPVINPLRSAFTPLPTFDVIVTDTAGEHTIHWTDGKDAMWEFKDICDTYDAGIDYQPWLGVRIEFNGNVFRERVFTSADE